MPLEKFYQFFKEQNNYLKFLNEIKEKVFINQFESNNK